MGATSFAKVTAPCPEPCFELCADAGCALPAIASRNAEPMVIAHSFQVVFILTSQKDPSSAGGAEDLREVSGSDNGPTQTACQGSIVLNAGEGSRLETANSLDS